MRSHCHIYIFLYVILFCLLVRPASSQSQSAYSVLFQNPAEEMPLDIIEDSIGSFFAAGYAGYDSQPNQFRGLLYRIQSATDTMCRRVAFNDTVTRFFKILPRPDHNFTILGTISNPPEYSERLLFAVIDKNLNILSRKEYALGDYSVIDRIEYLSGKNNDIWVYGSGSHRQNPARDFFLCKINGNGDTLKTGYYYPYNPLGFSAVFSPDSSYLWIFGKSFNFNGYGQRAIFDTNFNFISLAVIPSGVETNINVRWLTNSKMVLGGKYTFFTAIQNDDLGISFLDTALNNTSIHYFGTEDTIDNPGAERFLDFIDNSRIFYAGVHNLKFSFYQHEVSWIMTGLLGSNLNPLYQHFYGGDACYIPFSLIATKDGGSMIVGTRFDYKTQNNEHDVVFLKYDESGSITQIPDQGSYPWQSIVLYPNPGQDIINVTGGLENCFFKLYNQQGILQKSCPLKNGKNQVFTTDLQAGQSYIFRITNSNQTVITGKWIKSKKIKL